MHKTYRYVCTGQHKGGHMPGRQVLPDAGLDVSHEFRCEGHAGRHLEEEQDALLGVVSAALGDAYTVLDFLKTLH